MGIIEETEREIRALKAGESIVYHQGITFAECPKEIKYAIERQREAGNICCLQQRVALPRNTNGVVDWTSGIGTFQFLAIGRR